MKETPVTMTNLKNLRPTITAAVTACVLVFLFGLLYHILAAQLAAPANSTPIDPCALERFPQKIGEWTGQNLPMDEAIVRATDTDAHLNRQYIRQNGLESVLFYVACGVRARDLMPHRPEVCYTGSGWTLAERISLELPLDNGESLPCSVLQFSGGTFGTEKIMVLYYYIVDGQYSRDVSLLRSKVWRGAGAVGYVAQVQITTPVSATLTPDMATKLVSSFAVESALPTVTLFQSL
jgi:EpsI family protein